MKKVLIILAFVCSALFAAPHSFLPVSYTQPDGSTIELFASGDEFHNWLHDKDNYTIIQNDAGWYTYAVQDGEKVAASQYIVGKDEMQKSALTPGVNLSPALIQARYERMAAMRDYSNGRAPHHGLLNNLVVFIRFANDPDFSHTLPYYDNMFNNNEYGANSMKNYFLAASYQQLTVDSYFYPEAVNDVIVCYVDSHPRNYYKKWTPSNPIGYDEEDFWERTYREHTLLKNAIEFVEDTIPPSLILDGDNDGYVDNVCFIIQGNTEGWAELLWPHRWVLYGADAFIHGAQVWDFNFQLENSLNHSGASVLSHEMFHSLSAPDLYRYNDSTIDPIGGWDIMCANSTPPQHMGAWMKYKYGQWLDAPPIITESGTYTLSPLASSSTNNAYRIRSWSSNQYYVVEYRKGDGVYDNNLPGQGLLVYRLYPNVDGNADGPPDELYIYRPNAPNTTTNGNLNQAAFSQNSGRTMITENTTPSGFLNNNNPGGLNIFNIGEMGNTITFELRISDVQLSRPQGGEAWLSGSTQTISWKKKGSTGTVKLEYSADGGDSWNLIANNIHNSGTYNWNNVPHLNSENCYIRITLNSNGHTDINHFPFSIFSAVNPPTLLEPENQANNVATNPLLSWQANAIADGYYLEIADNPNFEPQWLVVENHPNPQYQLAGLNPHSTYFWRVASLTEYGPSLFSDSWQFDTGDITETPAVPQLESPPNMASNLPLNPELSWQASNLAESYRVQISMHPYFSEPEVNLQDISDTTVISPPLQANTLYFWRVAAVNSFATSNYSAVRRFTTGETVDTQDELNPPAQNRLWQNYPNPFSAKTEIFFSLHEKEANLSLKVYNIKGQLVRSLNTGAAKKGANSLIWDGKDEYGRALKSGIYLYRLQNGNFVSTRKLLISR